MAITLAKLRALLRRKLDERKIKKDAKDWRKVMVGFGPNDLLPSDKTSDGTAVSDSSNRLYEARAANATLDECVVSLQIFSADRGLMDPIEFAISRFLDFGSDPNQHRNYSYERFAAVYQDLLNVGSEFEDIDIRNGRLTYFFRGDAYRVHNQYSWEAALAKLYIERDKTILLKFVFQPEVDEEEIARLQKEIRAMEQGLENGPKTMREAIANASVEPDDHELSDDERIELIFAAQEQKDKDAEQQKIWMTPRKGEEELRGGYIPSRTPKIINPQDSEEWPLRSETPSSATKLPLVFSPRNSSLGERPLSPASTLTTPGKASLNLDDVLYREESRKSAEMETAEEPTEPELKPVEPEPAPSPPPLPLVIKKPASFTNRLLKRGQTDKERDEEWNRLFEIKEQKAYRAGGEEDDGEPEVDRLALDQEVQGEETEMEITEDDDEYTEKVISAGDRVVEKLQNLQSMPELTQIGVPDNNGEHRRWKECCKMFNIDPSKTALGELVTIAGLKTKIYQYQAFGVHWQMLTSRRLGGGFVADTMGLGKTLSFLALFVVERQLSCLWKAVLDSRAANDQKHLRKDQHYEGDSCPSRSVPGWIACPCASSSPTSKMHPKFGVRLACVPDNLVRNWWAEWKRHVDTSNQPILGLTIVVNYKGAFDDKTSIEDRKCKSDMPRNISRLTANKTNGQEKPEPWQSGWLVLTTATSYKDWAKAFDYKVQGRDQQGKLTQTTRSGIVFGIAMIDESHEEYFKNTGRGKVLHDIPSINQPFLWGYSGTPFSQTPRGLEGVLWAIEIHAKRRGNIWPKDPNLQQLQYQKLDMICADFDREFLSEVPDHAKVDQILTSFKPFLLNFIIRRTADTLWFGHRLIKLKPHVHQDIVLSVGSQWKTRSAHLQRAIQVHELQFQEEKDQRLLELQQKWEEFPEKRIMPNKPTALRFNTMCRLQWRLRVLASFPFLVKLLYPADPSSKLDLSPEEALGFVKQGNKIMDNPYYKHIRNIVEDSPKLLWLYSHIQRIRAKTEKDDKSEPQKLVIVTSFPQVAFILKMFMLKYFPEMEKNEQVGLILPRMKIKERAAMIEAFTDVEDVNGKRKHKRNIHILIGTTRLLGTGLQLTRAANIVLMEPDYEFVNEMQVYGRIHRIGQKHDCSFSYRLIDLESEIEKSIVERQRDRKEAFGKSLTEGEFVDMMESVSPK